MWRDLKMQLQVDTQTSNGRTQLTTIPVVDVGERFAIELIDRAAPTVHALLDAAGGHMPAPALKVADAMSRTWLKRCGSPYLHEIDTVGRLLGRPGAHFFNIHYEWGCTTSAKPAPDGTTARLVRVLDWKTKGLGRNIVAARIQGANGAWISLTWPGYTGALQGMAPGRFSTAINQAPMRSPAGAFYLDWAVNRARVWRMPHLTPAHLLRRVFEDAADFDAAKHLLTQTPICAPAIFTLAGLRPEETCVIERREETASVRMGGTTGACTANDWQQSKGAPVHPRGCENEGRVAQMTGVSSALDPALPWLTAPILNPTTRLVLIADAAQGRLVARGFEEGGPATHVLELAA
jgi:hypothetical protein